MRHCISNVDFCLLQDMEETTFLHLNILNFHEVVLKCLCVSPLERTAAVVSSNSSRQQNTKLPPLSIKDLNCQTFLSTEKHSKLTQNRLFIFPPEPEEDCGWEAGQAVSGKRRIQDSSQEPGDDFRWDPWATAYLCHGPPGTRRWRRGEQHFWGRHLQL